VHRLADRQVKQAGEAQLHWHTNRAKNLSRDQFAESHEVTNEQQASRRNDPVAREIRK